MGYEPNAPERLRRVLDSTTDLLLRIELQQALQSSPMPFAPSVGLRNAIAGCDACRSDGVTPIDRGSLCVEHRSRLNLEICADRAALQEGPHGGLLVLKRQARPRQGQQSRATARDQNQHQVI